MNEVAEKRAKDAETYWMVEGFSPGGVVKQVDHKDQSGAPLVQGIKIVDCDTHFTEPPDLWTSRAPAALKSKMPTVRRVDGVDRWFVGDRNFGMLGGAVIGRDHNKLLGRLSYPTLEQGHPGAWQVKPRLQAMDEMGIYAQICYQNSGVTQAGSLMALGDDELALSIVRIFNDAAAERQRESGERLFSMAILPIWDRPAVTEEARRCVVDLGLKGFAIPDRPEQWGLPDYTDDYWRGLFEICDAHRVPINFHLAAGLDGFSLTWGSFSFGQKLAVGAMMFSLANAATMGNFITSGLFDRYPNLKMCSVESGMGWVPFVLEALEYQFDEMLPDAAKYVQRRPKEYFRDHIWVTYWFETVGPTKLLEDIGVDKVLFETDFPHPTALYPGIQDHIANTLGHYDFDTRRRVLERNAVELYNLPF